MLLLHPPPLLLLLEGLLPPELFRLVMLNELRSRG
jgi:hypothetical protein